MSKHTPGPWEFQLDQPRRNEYPWFSINASNRRIASTEQFPCEGLWPCDALKSPEESEANAKLIAAAPELLEACRIALDTISKIAIETGDVYWINPPYQAAAVHESVVQRLHVVIHDATGEPLPDSLDPC